MPYLAIFEVLLGLYCFVSLYYYMTQGIYLVGPFLALYAFGFTSVGLLSITHTVGEYRASAQLLTPKTA